MTTFLGDSSPLRAIARQGLAASSPHPHGGGGERARPQTPQRPSAVPAAAHKSRANKHWRQSQDGRKTRSQYRPQENQNPQWKEFLEFQQFKRAQASHTQSHPQRYSPKVRFPPRRKHPRGSGKPSLMEVSHLLLHIHIDSSHLSDSSSNIDDLSCQIDLLNLVELDVFQTNKIGIPLGYQPEPVADTTYKPVLCSPTNSNHYTSVHSITSQANNMFDDHDNNFSNNANPQGNSNTHTQVLQWEKGNNVLNLSNLTITPPIQSLLDKSLFFAPTPGEPDFGQIFSDFEFHFRNIRLKLFFHSDPTSQESFLFNLLLDLLS